MKLSEMFAAIDVQINDKLRLPIVYRGQKMVMTGMVLGFRPKPNDFIFVAYDLNDEKVNPEMRMFASEVKLPFSSWLFLKKVQLKNWFKEKVKSLSEEEQ